MTDVDRTALRDLVHRYAAYLDDREFDSVAALFTDTAELVVPDPPTTLEPIHSHRSRSGIIDAVAAVAQVTRTQHAIVGEVYEVAQRDGHARGRISCIAHHWSQRGAEVVDVAWHLRYDDEYELSDAGWLIARRALTIDAIETRPARRLRTRR